MAAALGSAALKPYKILNSSKRTSREEFEFHHEKTSHQKALREGQLTNECLRVSSPPQSEHEAESAILILSNNTLCGSMFNQLELKDISFVSFVILNERLWISLIFSIHSTPNLRRRLFARVKGKRLLTF